MARKSTQKIQLEGGTKKNAEIAKSTASKVVQVKIQVSRKRMNLMSSRKGLKNDEVIFVMKYFKKVRGTSSHGKAGGTQEWSLLIL